MDYPRTRSRYGLNNLDWNGTHRPRGRGAARLPLARLPFCSIPPFQFCSRAAQDYIFPYSLEIFFIFNIVLVRIAFFN